MQNGHIPPHLYPFEPIGGDLCELLGRQLMGWCAGREAGVGMVRGLNRPSFGCLNSLNE